jgi:hypothetical protein
MIKKSIILAVAIVQSFLAVGQEKFEEKKVGHIYYISMPEYMNRTLELNEVALVQYQNREKETYCFVIEDFKEDLVLADLHFNNVTEFFDDFVNEYKTNFETSEIKNKKVFKNGNYNYVQCDFSYEVDEEFVSMLITVVETKNYYYKILCWTIPEYKEKHRADFEKIALSLRD